MFIKDRIFIYDLPTCWLVKFTTCWNWRAMFNSATCFWSKQQPVGPPSGKSEHMTWQDLWPLLQQSLSRPPCTAWHANSLIRFNTARMNTFYAHIGLGYFLALRMALDHLLAWPPTHWLQLHFHLLTIPSSVSSVGISISVSSFLVISLGINQSSVDTFSLAEEVKNFQLHKICINIQHPSTQ